MPVCKDLTGKRFGRYTVIRREDNNKHGASMWLCECDCGKRKIVMGQHLRGGHTLSCGCYSKELLIKNKTKHNKSYSRIYHEWQYIKRRCYNPNYKYYSYYGGRGITICDEWLSDFANFQTWALSNGYDDTLTLDRIDSNGNYEPNNCRWSTRKEQQNNRSTNLFFTIDGETKTLSQWCDIYNVPHERTRHRVKKGWDILDALTTPPNKKPI